MRFATNKKEGVAACDFCLGGLAKLGGMLGLIAHTEIYFELCRPAHNHDAPADFRPYQSSLASAIFKAASKDAFRNGLGRAAQNPLSLNLAITGSFE